MTGRIDPVLPAPDGLTMAFVAARRRRAGTASVTAFGAAVAMASVVSLLAPAGQTLVQEPLPPAGRVGPVPGVVVAPPRPLVAPGQSAPVSRRPAPAVPARVPAPAAAPAPAPAAPPALAPARIPTRSAPTAVAPAKSCRRGGWLACATVRRKADPGRASASAAMCRTAVSVTVDVASSARTPANRVELRWGRCDSP
jgi:2-oxoglutarate dehydrogenase E2 component (dihydrolipoamide succinyltransferase)